MPWPLTADTLANVIQRGLVFPATGGFLTPAHAAYSEGIALPYEPERARRLLAEAGYPNGNGLPEIQLVSGHASLSVEASLQYLQAQWHDNLGIRVVWETVWEMGEFLHRMRQAPPATVLHPLGRQIPRSRRFPPYRELYDLGDLPLA